MLMLKAIARAGLLAATLVVTGCATIVGSPTHLMPINSTPSEASVAITDEKGTNIFKGTTPTSVMLMKSDGSYWGGKTYTVVLSKAGYEDQTVTVKASPNGWYIGGNFIFGGLIGWLIVDPLNGHMYNLEPDNVTTILPDKAPPPPSTTRGREAISVRRVERKGGD
jgi:hypothetical protein